MYCSSAPSDFFHQPVLFMNFCCVFRICVGTWNVGGKLPPDDVDIDDWLDTEEPADIYVLG